MSDDLRRAMEADAAGGPAPDVAQVWRTGRRRRATRRWGAAAASAAAAVVLVAGIGLQATRDDDHETVRSGAAAETCRPRSLTPTEGLTASDGLPFLPQQAPRTPAAMVHGGGSEHLRRPTMVARVKVLSTEEQPTPNEYLLSPAPQPTLWARVEVTDPVFGAEVGDRFTISDAGTDDQLAMLGALKRILTQQIDDFQDEVDELNRPLADLDNTIAATDPADPGHADLLTQRDALKRAIDPEVTIAQNRLRDYQQRLQVIQINERMVSSSAPAGTSCHRFEAGDDLVVALTRPGRDGPYELTGPSSFFLIDPDGDRFSDELDAARRSVPGWTDSELLRLARESTPDEFLDRLRDAAAN